MFFFSSQSSVAGEGLWLAVQDQAGAVEGICFLLFFLWIFR